MTFPIDFNTKDRTAAPTRTVRVRRLDDGHFEFLEPVQIAQREFDVIVHDERPVTTPAHVTFAVWNLSVRGVPSRTEIYEDII